MPKHDLGNDIVHNSPQWLGLILEDPLVPFLPDVPPSDVH
jgi:hypothetical protein